jgi:tetratricopeptide (TPR) repeat protein
VKHYQSALKAEPGSTIVASNLAWILATHRNAEIRDGAQAIRLAVSCCQATGFSDASTVATLAAAYAEAGDYDKAAEKNRQALELLQKAGGQQSELDKLHQRQTLYESGQPYRQ